MKIHHQWVHGLHQRHRLLSINGSRANGAIVSQCAMAAEVVQPNVFRLIVMKIESLLELTVLHQDQRSLKRATHIAVYGKYIKDYHH